MKLIVQSGDMKINLNCWRRRGPRGVALFLQRKLPSPGSISRQRDLDLLGHFFLSDDVLMQFITEEFCSCIQNRVEGRNFSNNSSNTAIFHPRQDRGIATTLISHKEKVNAIEIFSRYHSNSKCTTSNASEHREQLNLPSRSVLQIKLKYGNKTLE